MDRIKSTHTKARIWLANKKEEDNNKFMTRNKTHVTKVQAKKTDGLKW